MLYLILIWIISIPFAFAVDFAYYQRKWPQLAKRFYTEDLLGSLLSSFYGPVVLIYNYFDNKFKYGLKWK